MKNKTKIVQLSEIKIGVFVRKALDQDHVLRLAELIENGVTMHDKMIVTTDNELVDGRHRKEAYELCKVTEVEVEVIDVKDIAQIISIAYRANTGGSLPPKREDTEHTVMLLLDHGASKKSIGELLGLPPSLARSYVNAVQSRLDRAKLLRAAAAISDDGLTVAKAAEAHGVDVEKLKELISGHRKNGKKDAAELKRELTTLFRSLASKQARLMRRLSEAATDGDISTKHVAEVFLKLDELHKLSTRSVRDWKKRILGGDAKTA